MASDIVSRLREALVHLDKAGACLDDSQCSRGQARAQVVSGETLIKGVLADLANITYISNKDGGTNGK